MFVEIVRLFTVVLLTAVGFMIGQDLGVSDKLAAGFGMLGCLAGYILGGFLGRLLERAVGVAERKAERVPIPQLLCGILGGGLGGVIGVAVALPARAASPSRRSGCPPRASRSGSSCTSATASRRTAPRSCSR